MTLDPSEIPSLYEQPVYEGESHWYSPDGQPLYVVPLKDGSGTRPTTVVDARALNLLPSVSAILTVLYKPGLDIWKQGQIMMSALTLPRYPGEDLDAFAKRALIDSSSEGRQAADAGTRIHKIIEWWLTLKSGIAWMELGLPDMTPNEIAILQGFAAWEETHKLKPDKLEHPFSNFANTRLGYGGRLDYLGEILWSVDKDGNEEWIRVVGDWKTEVTGPKKPFVVYPEWGVQLAAYAHGIGEPELPGLSVVISRNEPGRIMTHLWTEDWRWEAFEALKYVWHSPLGAGSRLRRGGRG